MSFNFANYINNESTFAPDLVIIYPGRFQPAHKNHAKVYKLLLDKFPNTLVYISTSNKVSLPKSPFTFDEKKIMLTAAGIPEKNIVQTRNPYMSTEITSRFNPALTRLIFAVGGKDMISTTGDTPRFVFNDKKEKYFKPLPPFTQLNEDIINSLNTFDKNGYISATPTYKFKIKILGNSIPITGASDIRELYKKSSEKGRQNIIQQLYGTFNNDIFKLFNNRIL